MVKYSENIFSLSYFERVVLISSSVKLSKKLNSHQTKLYSNKSNHIKSNSKNQDTIAGWAYTNEKKVPILFQKNQNSVTDSDLVGCKQDDNK